MPLSRARDYLSIGEVIESLRADFPDVSISKIRFLETEGLIAPERTQSGYRKFYEPDLGRLRYILALQRDHFLPLKVIKDRLASAGDGGHVLPTGGAPTAERAAVVEASPEVSLSREELAARAGVDDQQLMGLEEYGILGATEGGYDAFDLAAASAAKGLFEFGCEPRHLRMWRQAADREASFVEQIVVPVSKKRDPEARQEVAEAVARLTELADRLRAALLGARLRRLH